MRNAAGHLAKRRDIFNFAGAAFGPLRQLTAGVDCFAPASVMKKSMTTKLDDVPLYQVTSSIKLDDSAQPQSPKASTAVIDSTFLMDVGETVVIGTSSVKGDKALVALLTAAPRAGAKK